MKPSSNAVALYRPKARFTREQLLELGTLQGEANDVMSDAWRTSSNMEIPYFRASLVEAVEALTAMHYKWWKKEGTPNVEQARMELSDVLHFAVSDYVRGTTPEIFADRISEIQDQPVTLFPIGRYAGSVFSGASFVRSPETPLRADVINIQAFSFADLVEQFIASSLIAGRSNFGVLLCLFDHLGMTGDLAHATYAGKNALNKFRTANGQRDGSYYRVWDGIDDSDHLAAFMRNSLKTGQALTYQEVYNFLTQRYSEARDRQKK